MRIPEGLELVEVDGRWMILHTQSGCGVGAVFPNRTLATVAAVRILAAVDWRQPADVLLADEAARTANFEVFYGELARTARERMRMAKCGAPERDEALRDMLHYAALRGQYAERRCRAESTAEAAHGEAA